VCLGHAILWSIGVEHGDISEGNLMFEDVNTKKPKLCDFDLSHVRGEPSPSGYSDTGTWALMATELLTQKSMGRNIPRLYRHDFESFIADGELVLDPPLEEWAQNHIL
ncbi:hypothetical protein DFP72DRAFT_814557, partial [Ephemerocybe angulata]